MTYERQQTTGEKMKYINGIRITALAFATTLSVGANVASASNRDVNDFLVKARGDNYQEAVNAYDNLNARDRMVVDGIIDKTDVVNRFTDIKGQADALHHAHAVPAGWDSNKTQAFIDAAHRPLAAILPAAPSTHNDENPVSRQQQATTPQPETADVIAADINHAQHTADSAANQVALVNGKADTIQKEVMDNETRDDRQDAAIHHAQANADAALKTDFKLAEVVHGEQLEQANRERTASQHVTPVVGKDGLNGKDGADGKDGVTTLITTVGTDSATQQQVADNTSSIAQNRTQIRTVRAEADAQGEFIQQMDQTVSQHAKAIDTNSARIDQNSKRINQNAKRIDDTREDLKRGLNNAAAMTGLHYHSNDAYALSVGTSNGDGAAMAGGLSHSLTQHTAATVQGSSSMDGSWMASVGFSGDF